MFFKNLPLSFSFAESSVLRLQVNCKTFFVAILNDICLLALNPFAPGDFAEKRVLKLDEWFSGHCRAIKS